MRKFIFLSVFMTVLQSAHANITCSNTLITVTSQEQRGGLLIVAEAGKNPVNLTIQMTSQDGRIVWADDKLLREIPTPGEVMRKASSLLTYSDSDQGVLSYEGDIFVLKCM